MKITGKPIQEEAVQNPNFKYQKVNILYSEIIETAPQIQETVFIHVPHKMRAITSRKQISFDDSGLHLVPSEFLNQEI